MKKTLTALLLCGSICLNTASAEIQYNDQDYYLLVQGEESMSNLHQWYADNPQAYAEVIQLQDATLSIDNFQLPPSFFVSFSNAILEFDSIQQMEYQYMMPQLTVGLTIIFPPSSGNLTISLTDEAMKGMLGGQELDVKVEKSLLPTTFFQEIDDSQAFFVLHDAEGNAISEGETYTYIDEGGTHNYTNRGIIYDAGDLRKNEIALLFTGDYDPQGWGTGSFSVVALGESYIPVPEPATGTLGLLALAGLCARRRRK